MCSSVYLYSTASIKVLLKLKLVLTIVDVCLLKRHLGNKLRQKRFFGGPKKTPMDEAREALAETVLAHVPVRVFPYNHFGTSF